MRMPSFTLLAHNCHCQRCALSVPEDRMAGKVTGHGNGAGEWLCVYCGLVTFRFTPWYQALAQSVLSWLGWVRWEFQMWRLGY